MELDHEALPPRAPVPPNPHFAQRIIAAAASMPRPARRPSFWERLKEQWNMNLPAPAYAYAFSAALIAAVAGVLSLVQPSVNLAYEDLDSVDLALLEMIET